jgi:tripartite-type tricarboxylate transporter receptor subunit TctC
MQRRIFYLLLAAAAVCVPPFACAQPWPSKPIRLVVPFPPGGPTDIVARPLAAKLGEALGQPVLVENRAGAGGVVGTESVARATADGYTLLLGTVGTHAINLTLYPKLPYDPQRDFQAVSLVASAPVLLVALPSAAAGGAAQLLAQARGAGGAALTFGSAGNGTPGHLTGEMFKSASRARFTHIPYKGSAPAVSDLLGGHIQLMFDPIQSVLPHVKAGKIQAIATSGAKRSATLPNVPTFAEIGVEVETTAWWGLFAPAQTPREVLARLNAEIIRAMHAADMQEKLSAAGIDPAGTSAEGFADFLKIETAKWGKAVRDSGAKLD